MIVRKSWLAALILVFVQLAEAQSVASAELHGTVTDPSEALVPGVRVQVSNSTSALTRSTVTDANGEYRFLLLPAGEYSVKFDRENFKTQVVTSIRVTVGQVADLNVRLEIGEIAQLLEVTATPNLVESERSNQANTLRNESIETLPINRRDYLSFTLLAPGVADATALADNSDFRVRQTPHSGLSFYGSNGRGNSVALDGGEMNDAFGGVRDTISQEAVQEFQINRSNYSAEIGGASGGAINIISKSGTNAVHGTSFGFFRDDVFDAGDPFARVLRDDGSIIRVKPPANRQQFGGSLGMPLRKDRTFLFAALEGLLRNESAVTTLLTDTSIFQPTAAQMTVLSALPEATAGGLRAALTASPSTVDLFRRNGGVFPYTARNWKFSIKLDHNISERDRLGFRHSYSRVRETNENLQALVGASRGYDTRILDPTTLGRWTHVFGANLINELSVQWNYRAFDINTLEKFGPEIRIAGYGVFNRNLDLPSFNTERRYQFKDEVSYLRGRHNWKFGAEFLVRGIHAENDVLFGGRFTFGALPGSVLNPALPPTFTINALQAYNLGLAQTYQQGEGDPIVTSNNPYYAGFAQDSWKVTSNLTLDLGLRYELDHRKPPLRTDKNNFAPRFGFAWDPFRSNKTSVRGGYGIFYSPIYYQIDWVVHALDNLGGHRQIAQIFTTIRDPQPIAANTIFSALQNQAIIGNRSIRPSDLAQFGLSFVHDGPLPPFTILFQNSPNYVNPYSQQASLSIERQVAPDLAVSVGYTFVKTLKLPRSRDANLLAPSSDPTLGIRVWANPVRDFVDPSIAQRNVYESAAQASYSGMVVELTKRFSRSFTFDANYTLSRAQDEVLDFNSDFQASDQTNTRAERALSSFDQRHKFVAYGRWEAPASFEFAPVFRANSSRPFNLLVGYDLNSDRHATSDRPPFAGRNTGIGPNFWTFDLRVSRKFRLAGEQRTLEVMAEGFNLFNRLNFASINNTVGIMAPPFDARGRKDLKPSDPLGFTSAYETRRIQLGARLRF